MKQYALLFFILLVYGCGLVTVSRADLLECDEKRVPKLADIPIIGPKVASDENLSGEHEVRDFFQKVGCHIKKGATKAAEQAKKLGVELQEGAKKLGERAKDLGSDLKTRFVDFKEKLSKDSSEEMLPHGMPANVEIINPDVLKGEQHCGHGYLLDALGNCRKLRK